MQARRQPFSPGRSAKLKNTESGTCAVRIHKLPSSLPPIDIQPGVAPLGDHLLCEFDQASHLALVHTEIHHDDNHTFVHHCHSFSSTLPVHLEDHLEESNPPLRIHQTVPSKTALTDLATVPKSTITVVESSLHLNENHYVLYQTPTRLSRTLTHSFDTVTKDMTTVTSIPGSPPDLTDSRSSKSSSSGSNFTTPDDVSAEITNFEEIGLEDDKHIAAASPSRRGSRSTRETASGELKDAPFYCAQRNATHRPRQPRVRSDIAVHKSTTVAALKRGMTSPSMVSIGDNATRQRSNSPSNRLPRSASTFSLAASGFSGVSPRSSCAPPSRRGSWQPRKTAKEIEAEYHDSDDELPEDASLWNVPISPFPSGNRSAFSSARGSPERRQIPSPRPLPLEATHAVFEPTTLQTPFEKSSSRHRHPLRTASNDILVSASSPPRMLSRNGRAKSWNVAMSDLSAEARVLSQNLEIHAETRVQDDKYKDKWLPPIPHRSSAPGAIQLPPIQRGPLDFMPISKEKEAILSRTRPSWLPPKDPKEEKKHLKEYQKMMAASIEAEKRKENKVKDVEMQNDQTLSRINRIWDYYVEPSTDVVNIDRRVHGLCWRGIPSRCRGKVWQRTIGNSLGLSANTYTRALKRAEEIKRQDPSNLGPHEQNMLKSFVDIERDAETAFPELKVFRRDGPLWQDLISICEAHTCYRSDVGYFYGVQLIGALLLLQISDPAEAFILMENCLNNPIPHAFQTGELGPMQRAYHRVISMLAIKFPRLHDYLFETPEQGGLGLTGEEVLGTMLRTMFSNGLNLDLLCRVWDIWVFEGDRTLIRTAVAVLGSLQSQIFDVRGDLHLKRRNVQEMLGWGPFKRTEKGAYWQLQTLGAQEAFVEEIRMAGELNPSDGGRAL